MLPKIKLFEIQFNQTLSMIVLYDIVIVSCNVEKRIHIHEPIKVSSYPAVKSTFYCLRYRAYDAAMRSVDPISYNIESYNLASHDAEIYCKNTK